jgi:arginyl-tRNA synthetase
MLKSRSGASVKLIDLLDEAVARAAGLGQAETANAIGIGAVKYADLSADMIKDYTYDLDRMIAFTGDTGGYLQMAHARALSILRQAGHADGNMSVDHPAERGLALELLAVPGAIVDVAEQLEPHRLAGQVRRLAVAFTAFWESCPVLRADGDIRASRLALCDLTARMLAHGLDLLGIEAPDQM